MQAQKAQRRGISPHFTWLVTSRLDTTRHVQCVDKLVVSSVSSRAVRQARQPKCMGSTRRTCRVVSCRDVTSHMELGL